MTKPSLLLRVTPFFSHFVVVSSLDKQKPFAFFLHVHGTFALCHSRAIVVHALPETAGVDNTICQPIELEL